LSGTTACLAAHCTTAWSERLVVTLRTQDGLGLQPGAWRLMINRSTGPSVRVCVCVCPCNACIELCPPVLLLPLLLLLSAGSGVPRKRSLNTLSTQPGRPSLDNEVCSVLCPNQPAGKNVTATAAAAVKCDVP